MRYLVISDLHLGDGSKADDFGKRDKSLLNWIKKQKVDRIILAGDIYELWQFTMEKIRKAHPLLCKEFEKHKYIYLKGNHDYKLMGRMTRTIRLTNGETVLVSHGFQNDPFMKNPLARGFIWLVGKLERVIPWLDNPESWPKFSDKKKKSKIEKNTQRYVESLRGQHFYAVTGHTHNWKKLPLAGIIWCDAGTCQCGEKQGVIIDTTYSLVDVV